MSRAAAREDYVVKPILWWFVVYLAAVLPASSSTFRVNSVADEMDVAPGNGICLGANDKCTLRAAIMEANATPAFDTIVVPAGVHVLTLGELDITSNMIIEGLGMSKTIIDGGAIWRDYSYVTGGSRVLDIAPDIAVQVRSLTIRHGAVRKSGEWGGCIRSAGKVTLNTVAVTLCRTACKESYYRDVTCNGGAIANSGNLTVQDSSITDNSASSWVIHGSADGGGVYNAPGARLFIVNSLVAYNSPGFNGFFSGGGVENHGYLEVRNSTFESNYAFDGAALNNFTGATAKLTKSTFYDNTPSIGHGGSTISNSGAMTITNCTVSGNDGGVSGSGSALLVNNSTIYGNYGSPGLSFATVKNSIVAGNTAFVPEDFPPDCYGIISLGYNLIGNTTKCSFTPAVGDLVDISPKLGPLTKSKSGKISTHPLLIDSPAIDAGSPETAGSGGNACEKQDQRRVGRPQNGRCDIGAYERRVDTPQSGM
jgi:CSLREA domain-containing protein